LTPTSGGNWWTTLTGYGEIATLWCEPDVLPGGFVWWAGAAEY